MRGAHKPRHRGKRNRRREREDARRLRRGRGVFVNVYDARHKGYVLI